MTKNVKSKVEAIKKELEEPIPEPQEQKKMATKKKSGAKKTTKKSKSTAKKITKKTAASGVTLASLAKEAGVSGQKARQKLRAAGVERAEGGRWSFPEKSKILKAARKALGLK